MTTGTRTNVSADPGSGSDSNGPEAESFFKRHDSALEAVAKILVAYGILWFVWFPFFATDSVNDSRQDWSYGVEYKQYALTALFDYQEMPYFAWQGRHKGHRNQAFDAFFANPETPALSPTLPLYRFLEYPSATRLEVQIQLLVGVIGAYILLAAWLSKVSLAALVSFSLLYLCSGALAGHTIVGHGNATALFYLPLVFGLFLAAVRRDKPFFLKPAAIGCGALLAMLAYSGASHFLVHFLFFLAIYSLLSFAFVPEKRISVATSFACICVTFFLLAAYKLLPMLDIYSGYSADYIEAYASLSEMARQFLPFTAWGKDEHEFNSYVGIVGTAMILVALFYWNRRTAPLILVGVLFLLFTFLPVASVLQQNLPVFESQGAFSRFRIGFLFALSCVAAFCVHGASAQIRQRFSSRNQFIAFAALALLLAWLAVDLRSTNFELRRQELMRDPYPVLEQANIAPVPFRAVRGGIEVKPIRRGVNWAEYRYESVASAPPGDFIVSRVLGDGPGHLVFSGDIRTVEDEGGVRIYPTRSGGNFRYRFQHTALEIGGWISALSAIAVVLLGLGSLLRMRTRAVPGEER